MTIPRRPFVALSVYVLAARHLRAGLKGCAMWSGVSSVVRSRLGLFIVGLAIVLVNCVCAAPAHAQGSGDVSFYVSDQFKTVAKRIAVQIGAAEIERACPPDKPLCNQVA